MQGGFGFGGRDVARWFVALGCADAPPPVRPRTVLGQLVKSMLSGRTRDAVSLATYKALMAHYQTPQQLAQASPADIEAWVASVTFATDKAASVAAAMRMVA